MKQISIHHWSDMSNVPYKVRINRITIVRALLLLSIVKKVKEALRTRLSGTKITRTEIFVRSKKFTKWKTILNQGTLACYEKLALKKGAILLACNLNPPFPQISRFRSLHRLSSKTQKTLITDTCHWLESLTVILGFWKYWFLEKQSFISELFFLKV